MGEYSHSIDAKGRIILPADFRQELGLSFVITKGLDGCLFLYGQQSFEELAGRLRGLPLAKPEARAIVRFFFSGARVLECDKQGRFLVPANLRAYAALELRGDVVLAGADSRIEVWSRARWAAYAGEVEPAVTQIAAQLAELGI